MAVHTWTVEELCAGVSIALADAFPDQCWVKGQIRGLRRSPAGHLYFDLVDDAAAGRGQDPTISVVAFRGPLRGIEAVLRKVGDLRLEDGLDVRIRGRIDTNWVGLVVTSDWLIDVTADLVGHHAVGPGDDALRPKDWLHLSLAYGVDDLRSHAARAGSFDAGAAGGWELGLYERRHDGSWSRLR